mgnify:CR=1 FL=1
MNITVINSSPHKNGTSVLLTEKFIEGLRKMDIMFIGLMLLLRMLVHVKAVILV